LLGNPAALKKYTRALFDENDNNEIFDPIMDKFIRPLKKRLGPGAED